MINRSGLSRLQSKTAVETILKTMKSALERGERIELRGFGVFEVRTRKTRIGRNPRTGEVVQIPSRTTVRFQPGKAMRSI